MEEREFDVICIGFIARDIIMTGIPQDALEKDSVAAEQVIFTSGGDANNQAVVLSRLGSRTALLAKLGTTPEADSIFQELEQEKLDTSFILRKAEVRNLLAVCVCKPNGERTFLVDRGENYHLRLEEIDETIFFRTRAITLGSLFNLGTLDIDGAAWIFQKAKSYGVWTVADMTADLNGIGTKAIQNIYPYTDFLIPSMEEASYVTGLERPEEMAEWFLRAGVGTVIIKLGKDGCYIRNRQQSILIPAFQVEAIDTTGCGDNFVAGFVHALLKGKNLREAGEFACAAGAINALGAGAHRMIMSEEQVYSFMEQQKTKGGMSLWH